MTKIEAKKKSKVFPFVELKFTKSISELKFTKRMKMSLFRNRKLPYVLEEFGFEEKSFDLVRILEFLFE